MKIKTSNTGIAHLMGLILGLGMILLFSYTVHAEELATPILDINGKEVYDGSTDMVSDEDIPAGITFDPATYTVTLTDVNLTAAAGENFIDGKSYGGNQTKELHIVINGNNVITRSDTDGEYAEELFRNNGNMTIEGSGTLTVNNNMGGLAELHDSNRRDLTIRNCTITSAYNCKYNDFIDVNHLTLDGCTINTDYAYTEDNNMVLVHAENGMIMNNSVWNVNTSAEDTGSGYSAVSLEVRAGGEFHNSTFKVTGPIPGCLSCGVGEYIYDNASFLGEGEITGINYAEDGKTYTYHNFINKHQYTDDYENVVVLYGKYSQKDLWPKFEIVPYTGQENPSEPSQSGSSVTPTPQPSNAVTPTPQPSSAVTPTPQTGIKAGSVHTVSGSQYTVLSQNTVAVKKARNKKSVTIPATVKIGGKTFKVTQINANAFKGKKIRTVTLGKNIKVLKKNAFKGSKATKIILKTKLLKKAKVKGCLKGSKVKTVQVKIGKKSVNKTYVKKYKKIFTKAIAGKKVTVK